MVKKKSSDKSGDSSPFVKLGASLGGILLVVVLFVLIFASSSAHLILSNVIWGFVVLGLILAFFEYLSQVRKKK